MNKVYWVGLVSWVVSAAYSATLQGITFEPKEHSVSIYLEFDEAVEKYEYKSKIIDGTPAAVFTLNAAAKELEGLEFLSPIQYVHMQKLESTPDNPKTKVTFYFETDVDLTHTSTEEKISIELPFVPQEIHDQPSSLNVVDNNSIGEDDLTLKLEFDRIPGQFNFYLTDDRKHFVALFYNTAAVFPATFNPSPKVLNNFKVESGKNKLDAPWIRITGQAEVPLKLVEREEEARLFFTLSAVQKVVAKPTDYEKFYETEAPASDDYSVTDVEASNVKKHAVEEEEKSKTWLYLTLGAGTLVGGAAATYFFLQSPEEPPPPPGITEIPVPNIQFPTDPE